jgi:hypothetical protein
MSLLTLGKLIVAISIFAVAKDAKKMGLKRGTLKGFAGSMGPKGWFISCWVLWIFYFPYYLYKRKQYARALNYPIGNKFNYFGYACIVLVALIIGPTIMDIATEARSGGANTEANIDVQQLIKDTETQLKDYPEKARSYKITEACVAYFYKRDKPLHPTLSDEVLKRGPLPACTCIGNALASLPDFKNIETYVDKTRDFEKTMGRFPASEKTYVEKCPMFRD